MSSLNVRTEIKNYFSAELPGEVLIDWTSEERPLGAILQENSLDHNDSFYAIQFIGSDEEPIAIASNTNQGCYRETGAIYFHVVVPSGRIGGQTAAERLLPKAEALRDILRGARINGVVIESVTPPNTEAGATLEFEQGFMSASVIAAYYYDINL
jgi:hypothetical protein